MNRGRESRLNWIDVALISLVVGVAIAHAWVYRFETIDDAYITYRYAENLARGYGFVFNPGDHVEGTSTFLFTLLLALAKTLGSDIEFASRFMSMVAFATLTCVAYHFVRATSDAKVSRLLAFGSSLTIAGSTSLAYYAAIGMELTLFILLTSSGLFAYLRNCTDAHEGRHFMAWLALAATVRTEGISLAALVASSCFLEWFSSRYLGYSPTRCKPRDIDRRVALSLSWLSVILLPLYAFRLAYFGALVPNSVLAKSGTFKDLLAMPFAAAAHHVLEGRALDMLDHFVNDRLGLLVFLLPLGWLSARYRRQTSLFAATCVLFILPLIWNDGDWMPHARLLAPTIPLIAVAFAASISSINNGGHPTWKHWLQVPVAIATFAYAVDHLYYERSLVRSRNATADYMCELGRILAQTSSGSELLATDMAGRVPYFSKIRTLDVFGLNDTHIARYGTPLLHMGKTDFGYVYPKRPNYYFYNVRQNIRYMYDNEKFRPFVNDYWLVMTPFFRAQHGARGKVLLVRKDLARLSELLQHLNATVIDPRTYR